MYGGGGGGLVEPEIAFLSIGFEDIFCQSEDQHYGSQSYVAVSRPIKTVNA